MRIVVLVKPVPDPTAAGERLGPDGRLDRAAVPAVVNGNDEYALEAALKLVEAHGGEVTLLSMAPSNAPETMRKALAMGAARGRPRDRPGPGRLVHLSTARVLAAALDGLEYDLVLAGVDTSDGGAGVVPAGGRHAGRPAVPLVRRPDRARRGGRPGPRPAPEPDRLRRDRGAAAGPRLVHPGARRAALPVAQGDHGRPVEGDRGPLAGGPRDRPGDGRRRGRHDAGPAVGGATRPRRHARRARARAGGRGARSSTSSSSGGSSDGPARSSSARSARTAASPGSAPRSRRSPGRSPRPAGTRSAVWWSRPTRTRPRAELARYLPEVEAVAIAGARRAGRPAARRGRGRPSSRRDADSFFSGASPDGRDVAGDPVRPPRLGRPDERDRGRLGGRWADRRDERVRRPAGHLVRVRRPGTGSSPSARTSATAEPAAAPAG